MTYCKYFGYLRTSAEANWGKQTWISCPVVFERFWADPGAERKRHISSVLYFMYSGSSAETNRHLCGNLIFWRFWRISRRERERETERETERKIFKKYGASRIFNSFWAVKQRQTDMHFMSFCFEWFWADLRVEKQTCARFLSVFDIF